ncbi:CLUMA_CG009769, isoform A [Clunio marinus]|uniref:CLUMA_CG009769, isoform A n=1 Tax=Clunio marinus TaxID=568069 RepID=A0A1J1I7V9_9DIPT|nr:CLUMA_CG009769, isoform A [Clunio marinus]
MGFIKQSCHYICLDSGEILKQIDVEEVYLKTSLLAKRFTRLFKSRLRILSYQTISSHDHCSRLE